MIRLHVLFRKLRWLGGRLADPLRVEEGSNQFRLSIPEAATTTYDGDVGWANRPPAMLECPRCGEDVLQHRSGDGIDCPRCVAEFTCEAFPDLTLRYMICPVCRNRMQHGRRHPEVFDVPEWATCGNCWYHWEFDHWY